jgi:HD superfamily phosphohydrolase YqeK
MHVLGEIAPIYGLDRELAETIGILHDAAKDLSQETWQQLVIEGGIQQQYEFERDYNMYLHGPVGAYFVQRELGITDTLVLEAISTHTSYGNSRYYNHPMCWCLRFADILEPNRCWGEEPLIHKHIDGLRALVYAGDLDQSVYLLTRMLIAWFEVKGFPIHPNWKRAHNDFAVRVSSSKNAR